MLNKIRLHKYIWDYIKKNKLEYTLPESKKNISNFGVNIDGNLVFNHQEWVSFHNEININNWPKRTKGKFDELKIIYQNDDFLLVDKPKNLVVEEGAGHKYDNMVYNLSLQLGYPVFNVHRIDKDTSGLILVAKNKTSLEYLQKQFKDRKVEKKYICLVKGIVEKNTEITNWQFRDKSNVLRQKFFWHEQDAIKYNEQAKFASSMIKPICYSSELDQSLIQVQIFTGRMHQIRLQCESLGFGLVDDAVYNKESIIYKPFEQAKYKTIQRKTLHHNEYKKVNTQEKHDKDKKEGTIPFKTFFGLEEVPNLDSIQFEEKKHQLYAEANLSENKYLLRSVYLSFLGMDGHQYAFSI